MLFLCLKIFMARIIDVTIGTIRTMFIVKENKLIASILAFFELIIWYYAARQALNTTEKSILIPIFYALGFGVGTYIGIIINKKIIKPTYELEVYMNSYHNELDKYHPFIIKGDKEYLAYIVLKDKKDILDIKKIPNTKIYVRDIKLIN